MKFRFTVLPLVESEGFLKSIVHINDNINLLKSIVKNHFIFYTYLFEVLKYLILKIRCLNYFEHLLIPLY